MTKVLQIPRIILLSFLCLCLRYKAFRLCIIISCSVKSQLCNTSAKFNSFLKTKKNKKNTVILLPSVKLLHGVPVTHLDRKRLITGKTSLHFIT